MSFKILTHGTSKRYPIFGGTPRAFKTALVEFDERIRYEVSRYPDESFWAVDSAVNIASGFPYYVHGAGDRSCLKTEIIPEIAVALDALNWDGGE